MPARRDGGVQAHPPLLEVHRPQAPLLGGVGDLDVGLDPVVRHRQQPDAEPGSPQRSDSRAVTCESVSPWPSSRVRTTCVARSRSPRVNQSGPSP